MIHVENRGSIEIIRLEDGKVNALDMEMLSSLVRQLAALEHSTAKAFVLTGTGACFSAGVDLFKVVDGGAAYLKKFLPMLSDALFKLFTFPRPVVAAANGHAIAGGCILVFACDYKIMAKGSGRIGVPELLVGVPFPALPLEIVRFTSPRQHLQQIVYGGRNYTPEEALQLGIIDRLAEPKDLLDHACDMAEQLGSIPPEAFRITKQLVRQPAIERFKRYRETIDKETERVWSSPEIHEAIREYLQRTIGK